MGTGYTRNDTVNNIADGNIINASDIDGEFDSLQAAFDAATGHTHDGTTAEGAPIEVTGPAQEYVSTGTEFRPKANNTYDLGSSGNQWKDLYVDGTANLDAVDIDGGNIDGTIIGAATAAAGTFTTATATTGNITTVNATTVDTTNIEVTNLKAKDGTAAGSIADSTGVVTLASSVLTTTDINGGTIDGVTLGTNSAVTEAQVDNININGNTIISTNTDGNIALTPNGTGEVDISKVDIDGGTIDGTVIGGSSAAAITGTTITATGDVDIADKIVHTGDTNTAIRFPAADTVTVETAGTERLRIDSSGNVGIGTSSPSAKLDLQGTAAGNEMLEITHSGASQPWKVISGESGVTNEALIIDRGASGEWMRFHAGLGTIFSYDNTERARIDSSGNLLVGTTAASFGENLKVANSGVGKNVAFFHFSSTDDRGVVITQHNGSSGGTSRKHYVFLNNSSSEVGSISVTGTATAFNTSSDYRLKENVTPLSGAADRLAQIPVHRFNFIADPDRTVDGFLAHEVQAFVPEAITGEKDEVDAEGKPVYQGIDQSKLTPLITAALQEALKEIADLKARVAALEA